MKAAFPKQKKRAHVHRKNLARRRKIRNQNSRLFDYDLNYKKLDLRKSPDLYRVGRGEQGVLLVEPYKSEILPLWRFKTLREARQSARAIYAQFRSYVAQNDFVGMDMARKFMQMGYTRARRYANHASGRKYARDGRILPRAHDADKAAAAKIFQSFWRRAEKNRVYSRAKARWKLERG